MHGASCAVSRRGSSRADAARDRASAERGPCGVRARLGAAEAARPGGLTSTQPRSRSTPLAGAATTRCCSVPHAGVHSDDLAAPVRSCGEHSDGARDIRASSPNRVDAGSNARRDERVKGAAARIDGPWGPPEVALHADPRQGSGTPPPPRPAGRLGGAVRWWLVLRVASLPAARCGRNAASGRMPAATRRGQAPRIRPRCEVYCRAAPAWPAIRPDAMAEVGRALWCPNRKERDRVPAHHVPAT